MEDERITLPYGEGGYLSQELIKSTILKYFKSDILKKLDDAAQIGSFNEAIFTTDSYVVSPLFFEGGNIGKLAIAGTVNDLLVTGAQPKFVSCSFIIEEGLEFDVFEKILMSMAETAEKSGVEIVTGDTKVVERGKGDGIYINTSGVGLKISDVSLDFIENGDKIIINGGIAEHGVAILLARAGEKGVKSDCAPLSDLILDLLEKYGNDIHFMRDPTRGGLAQVLLEVAESIGGEILIDEQSIPIDSNVKEYCELMGFDPLYIANEGKCVFFVSQDKAEDILQEMRKNPLGKNAMIIGEVKKETPSSRVLIKTELGGIIPLRPISGAQYPRIC